MRAPRWLLWLMLTITMLRFAVSGFISPLIGRELVAASSKIGSSRSNILSRRAPPPHSAIAQYLPSLLSTRLFASKKPRKLSSKQRRKRESEKAKRRNDYMARQKKLKRQKNLHPAAKMKRVLSAADYWFSTSNLRNDDFLQEQLYNHKGHVPLSVFLKFPKFQHWVDLPILHQAFSSEAAKKRYSVVISQDLMEHGKEQVKLQKKERREYEKRLVKRERELKRLAKQKRRQRKKLEEERYQIVGDQVRQRLLEEQKEWIREERLKQEADARQALLEESSVRGILERNRSSYVEPVIQVLDAVDSLTKPAPLDEDTLTLEDIDEESVHDEIVELYDEFYEFLELYDLDDDDDDEEEEKQEERYASTRKNDWNIPLKSAAIDTDTVDAMNKQVDNVDTAETASDSDSDPDSSFDFDPLLSEKDAHHASSQQQSLEDNGGTAIDSGSTADDTHDGNMKENQKDDEVVDLLHALVRPKRVTFELLQELAQPIEMMDDDWGYYDEYDNYITNDEWDEQDDDSLEIDDTESPASNEPKNKKPKQMQQYGTKKRQVVVIQNSNKLKNFCDMLMGSVQKTAAAHGNDPNFSAIGFDVEYCSLELDIRGTLPAMLQLAGPGDTSPVGLIWLDKFPDHGRNMIGKEEYEPLLKILADPDVLKIGVGASKDVNHLAEWWGINDRHYTDYYFAGVTDLEYQEGVENKRLAEMCQDVLGMKLPKQKEKRTKNQKKRKKAGKSTPTSHWRRDDITKQMKEYAANDAACGIDVWMKLKTEEMSKKE